MGRSSAGRGNGSAGQFASWAKRNQINTLAAQVDANLVNFPVFLNETILNNLPDDIWSIAQNGGGDLRFSSDEQGANRLPCEVVTFNTSTQVAEIHVKIPAINSVINTPLYIFYGKSGVSQPVVTDTYGRNAVWDSDFLFVGHLGNGTDSTGKTSLQGGSATTVSGQVGQAADFNGSSDKYDYSTLAGPAGQLATFEFWTNFDVLGTGTFQAIVNADGPADFHVEQNAFDSKVGYYNNSVLGVSTWDYTQNTWQHTSIAVDASIPQATFRLNYATINNAACSGSNVPLSAGIVVGAWFNGSFQRFLNGTLDELRISKVYRVVAWRKASYINQNLTTDFLQAQSFITP